MAKKIKVLVCDDSAIIRSILSRFIQQESDMELVGTAIDPYDAREKIKQLNPDVLTLDVEMPKMDGLTFLEKIMTLRPMPVVMVSTLTQRGAEATLQALETGAFDYQGKPQEGLQGEAAEIFRVSLLGKIRAAAESRIVERYQARSAQSATSGSLVYNAPAQPPVNLIAIGSSTGGVEALRDIFSKLPGNLPPIAIVQHMPVTFTGSFAARLNEMSAVQVSLAKHNQELKSGAAYVANGGQHLLIGARTSSLVSRVHEGVPVSGHCPSVDVMFESAAHATGGSTLAVILTGMGRDGANGMLAIHKAGGRTIGQNESSCVVYGMPKAAFLLGGVQTQCALDKIPAAIVAACEGREVNYA